MLVPKVALLDPSVTAGIPLKQTAYGCIDVFSHLNEGFFSHNDSFSPIQEGYALALSKAVKLSMDKLQRDPEDMDARGTIMWAASLGWNGLGSCGWQGAGVPCHTLEHPLSGLYDLPHGAGLAIVTPAYLKMRKDELGDRLIRFGTEVLSLYGKFNPDDVIEELKSWFKGIGAPVSFGDWEEVPKFNISALVRKAEELDAIWRNSGFKPGDIRAAFDLML